MVGVTRWHYFYYFLLDQSPFLLTEIGLLRLIFQSISSSLIGLADFYRSPDNAQFNFKDSFYSKFTESSLCKNISMRALTGGLQRGKEA